MKKKILILMLTILFLSGCTSLDKRTSTQTESVSITDSYGRAVEVPKKVERIVGLGNAPRFLTYLDAADRIVGVPSCEVTTNPNMAYAYVNQEEWSKLPVVGNDALGACEWYPEEIISCQPDVILCTYDKETADNIQNQTGIPVVSVTVPSLFSEEYNESIRIVGKTCGADDRAEEVITYINESLSDLRDRAAQYDKEKPTVVAACATFKGGHSIDGVYTNYPVFDVLSVNDMTKGIANPNQMALIVDKEQIIAWNPDIFFIDASNIGLLNTDYEKEPGYFKQLDAINSKELYQWPNSTCHYSNVEIPLVSAYYVGSLLYPEEFKDIDFNKKASEIFDFFLHEKDYLNILEKAGCGYGKAALGGSNEE